MVSLAEIRENDYSLTPKKYMGGIDVQHLPFDEAYKEFLESMDSLKAAEEKTKKKLIEEGYLHE